MDSPEFLNVVPQMGHHQDAYSAVEVYGDVVHNYTDYSGAVVVGGLEGACHSDEMLEPSLRVASNLFENQPDDLLSVKIENVECVNNTTDDESMAVEALRQLGNSTYKNTTRIETATPHDLPLLPCPTCELEFRTTADLNGHAEICGQTRFLCPICNEPFDRKTELNNHLVCHAVDRPHACRICGALFIQKEDHQKHMLTHSGAKNLLNRCQVCGQQFQRASSLTNHMKIHNYQAGRALINPKMKIGGDSELADILTGNSDPQMQRITLPSISDMNPMSGWNLSYEPDNLNFMRLEEEDENFTSEVPDTSLLDEDKRKPYACTRCSKRFAREKALTNHLNLHRDVLDDYYTCERCEQGFNNDSALQRHLQYCGVKPQQKINSKVNNSTPESFDGNSKKMANEGIVDFNNTKIESDDFNKTIATTVDFNEKSVASPDFNNKKARMVNPPPSELLNDANFDVGVYNKIYKHGCRMCGKNFTTKQKLYRHMWIHRKKSFPCELCSKTFDERELLDAHRLSSHQWGSPYVCPECGKNFSSRQGLWEHNRIHTTETNSFRCAECPKTFTSRQGYLIHKRKHTDERPYGCRFCWKAFRDGGTLRKHERIHTGERPHACPLCLRAFNQKVVLREHVRWLHTANSKPDEDGLFHCTLCPVAVDDKDELCVHLVKHSDAMAQLAKEASKDNVTNQKPNFKSKTQQELVNSSFEVKLKQDVSFDGQEEDEDDPTEVVNDITEEIIPRVEDEFVESEPVLLPQDEMTCDLCGLCFSSKVQLSEHVRVHI